VNADLAARLAVLEELYDALAALVGPLDEAALNWAPLPGANSIAALTVHIAGSMNSWLARALAEPHARDREAEFRAHRAAAELLATIEESRRLARDQLARLDGVAPGTMRSVRRLSSGQVVDVSVAWCIEHALIHAGEHWGQIQLTRDLYLNQ
jgi:uncharacterized damage-inducible protein DinB